MEKSLKSTIIVLYILGVIQSALWHSVVLPERRLQKGNDTPVTPISYVFIAMVWPLSVLADIIIVLNYGSVIPTQEIGNDQS